MRRDLDTELEVLDRAVANATVVPQSAQAAADRAGWAALEQRLGLNSSARESTKVGSTPARSRSSVWMAGLFGLVIAVAFGLFVPRASSHSRARTYTTAFGQRMTLTLADRSQIVLAPRTTITMTEGADRTTRAVSLVGEAYFNVVAVKATPFSVRAGDVTVRVLGTAFDVVHDRGAETQILVRSGKVQAQKLAHHPVTLVGGMIAHMSDSTTALTTASDMSPYTGWASSGLVFRGAPLGDVLTTLTRWYGVQFRTADHSLDSATVSGRLDFATTSEVVDALKAMLDVHTTFTKVADTTVILLHARHGVSSPNAAPRGVRDVFPQATEVGR